MPFWRCRGLSLPVGERTLVMGILNVTPDSFSDGGAFLEPALAVARALEMVSQGADIVDVGGESTRPGAAPVPYDEEMARVVPVIKAIAAEVPAAISIDTTKAGVAAAALDAGAVIVNDVSALRSDPAMAGVVADSAAGVVLMHMLGEPRTMQDNPHYDDVVAEVAAALAGWAEGAEAAGVDRDRIVIDPGIGFGKTAQHNLQLLANLRCLTAYGYPVLVGPSRKSFIGATLKLAVNERREATAAAVAWSVASGASAVRVHDVAEMLRVVRMSEAIRGAARPWAGVAGAGPQGLVPASGLPTPASGRPISGIGLPTPASGRPISGIGLPTPASGRPTEDRVIIRGLRVFGYHGVHADERREGQEFVVDLEAYLDLAPAGAGDQLAQTLDYSAMTRQAATIVAGERYDLIEALAERLAGSVLADARVQRCVVRVAKPQPAARRGADEFAVQIERWR